MVRSKLERNQGANGGQIIEGPVRTLACMQTEEEQIDGSEHQ